MAGLSALSEIIEKPNTAVTASNGAPVDIKLSDLAPDPDQPRKQFDQSVIDAMATQFSNPEIGQIEAIFARANPSGFPAYLIVHGETRYRAAKQAGLESLKGFVTADGGFIRQVLSNETRADLPVLDKARAYLQLIEAHGFNQKSVAALLGKDESHVSMHIALNDMPPLVEQAYSEGKATTVRVLDDLRKLVATHQKNKKGMQGLANHIKQCDTITRSQVSAWSKEFEKKRPKRKKQPLMIGGKIFTILAVEQSGDDTVINVKLKGEKSSQKYKLIAVD